MTSELRSLRPSPVQAWGETHAEYQSRRAAERRPKRSCVRCSAILSQWNPETLCGPCRFTVNEIESCMENHPAKGVTEVYCKWCLAPFTRGENSRRRLCEGCWK
jgi:hypothetical protein